MRVASHGPVAENIMRWTRSTPRENLKGGQSPFFITHDRREIVHVELKAGYPKRHRQPDAQSNLSHAAQRDQERRLLAQAEEAYRTLVAARHLKGDAAATKRGAS
jgi:hypothetical protein